MTNEEMREVLDRLKDKNYGPTDSSDEDIERAIARGTEEQLADIKLLLLAIGERLLEGGGPTRYSKAWLAYEAKLQAKPTSD